LTADLKLLKLVGIAGGIGVGLTLTLKHNSITFFLAGG
jgi:hypothetical protein